MKTSLTYAIPDIHGRVDLLNAAVNRIVSHAAGLQATIVTLGDYVDRGPNSREVLEFLMNWRSDSIRLVSLKGNHEAMMWEACNGLCELEWWIKNGGGETLMSYAQTMSEGLDPRIVPQAHLCWIAGLQPMQVDRHRIFVHAGLDPAVRLADQGEQTLLWKRYAEGADIGHGRRHVVHGHHACLKAPIVGRHKTNLDGLAWKTGRLVVGVFEDERPGGAREYLEILGEADPRNLA